jgi:hypothetical protein
MDISETTSFPDNHWDDICAMPPFQITPPIPSGGFEGRITVKWYVQGASVTNDFVTETQSYKLYTNGDMSLTKYKTTITRSTNDVIKIKSE